MNIENINVRYSELANSECCLSCGGAINYAKPQLNEVCIDLGSGRGTDVLRIADDVGEFGFVYGVDISDGMLEKAKKNAGKLKINNVKFIKCELEKLNLENNIADLVISNCTINHAVNKQAVWNEIFRVLKKGGRFVVSDIYATQQIADEFKNDAVAVSECWAGAVVKDEYLNTLVEAGFENIEILEESAPYPKGNAEVVSFTIYGKKPSACCCCH
ncbi:MAG: methyltransferase domain-containing protein [Bacteroidota bacterium]